MIPDNLFSVKYPSGYLTDVLAIGVFPYFQKAVVKPFGYPYAENLLQLFF